MAVEKYKLGQKITVTRVNDHKDEHFYSTIQNVTNGEIYIDIPYQGDTPLVLTHHEQINVKYVSQNGAFTFTASFLGVHKETEVLNFYRIGAPAEQDIKKIQLREFVRVPMMLDVEYYLQGDETKYKGTTVDLSAGGMRLASKNELQKNQVLDLYFTINKKNRVTDISLKGQVVRCELIDQQMNLYHAGLKFLNITRWLEETLVSFVFEKQIDQLRKR
ncbi:PilZ domain-containing protein [Peptococcaceae bacterium 1198_IL3148]